ncbi:hypothetical protein ceV_353 [Chrysochromulina ericina virus CeV-01B]|uniref:Minor capsid protein P11 C-terminal conserved region domain-containing protein n=1 Tax=Chrysochromulina ericina virus CeV-01B TaxID=3070830 RepID=A0A0N9QYV4_9VIRU|nr:hypothetical protein ceV_353 [Chrysochromulina ericina virus]ALH23259.1 hypothetical protein ceV_353 [Chrysochromulina ericina virus CeV-01B]
MSFRTEINRLLKNRQLCMILAILAFLGVVVFVYNNQKGSRVSAMNNPYSGGQSDSVQYSGESSPSVSGSPSVQPAMPAGLNSVPGSADGMRTVTAGVPESCLNQQSANPSDLLPNDPNSAFAMGQPIGQGELSNINLLKAGQLSGIDTVGGTLRNANLQLRSEPPNPRSQVSPWLNSTIEPDLMRVPLELGCGAQ